MALHAIHYRFSTLGSHALYCSCGNAEISRNQQWETFQAQTQGKNRVVACRACGWTDLVSFDRRIRRSAEALAE